MGEPCTCKHSSAAHSYRTGECVACVCNAYRPAAPPVVVPVDAPSERLIARITEIAEKCEFDAEGYRRYAHAPRSGESYPLANANAADRLDGEAKDWRWLLASLADAVATRRALESALSDARTALRSLTKIAEIVGIEPINQNRIVEGVTALRSRLTAVEQALPEMTPVTLRDFLETIRWAKEEVEGARGGRLNGSVTLDRIAEFIQQYAAGRVIMRGERT